MGEAFWQFKEALEKTIEEFKSMKRMQRDIRKIEENTRVLNKCILKLSEAHASYPIIVGNGMLRASITNLGTFPPIAYNKHFIYPLGYTVKKRFKPHRNYKKSLNNKVLYVCTVEKDGIGILADDGFSWKGENLWNEFKNDVGIENEFVSLEDFMALTNPSVGKMIEKLGDFNSLNGYVPLEKRN